MPTAIDISNYSGRITARQVACWKAAGVALVVVGTQDAAIASQQLSMLRDGGIAREAYVYLYLSSPTAPQVQAAESIIAPYGCRRLWLDAEDDQGALSSFAVREALIAARKAVTAPLGWYTRRGWWRQATGDYQGFRADPLWDARYPAPGSDVIPAFIPYGGWTAPAMTQYHDTTTLCGVSVDLDVEEPMTPEERQQFDAVAAKVFDLQQQVTALAQGTDSVLKGALKYLWALARKPWPWGS